MIIVDFFCITQDDGSDEDEEDATPRDELNDQEEEHGEEEEEQEEEEEKEEAEEEEEEETPVDSGSDPPDDSEFIEVSFVMTSPPIRPKTSKRKPVPRFANGRTYKGITINQGGLAELWSCSLA